jgi:SAM-dependent methyltransferase
MLDGFTRSVLLELGVDSGWRCWEVGAGRGSIARWLAAEVGAKVLATDIERRGQGDTPPNLTFAVHDVVNDPPPACGFNLIHARLVLEHLADPRASVARLCEALAPDGLLVAEDSAGLTFGGSPALERLVPSWERAGLEVGWNASYGTRLIHDLRASGLVDLKGREYRVLAPGGVDWEHVGAGLRRLRNSLLEQGVTEHDLESALRDLSDPRNLLTGSPIAIVWGRRVCETSARGRRIDS